MTIPIDELKYNVLESLIENIRNISQTEAYIIFMTISYMWSNSDVIKTKEDLLNHWEILSSINTALNIDSYKIVKYLIDKSNT